MIRKNIPNAITCLNLICGCMSIAYARTDLMTAGLFIMLAGVFDFLDGLAARLLKVHSHLGLQLDSLADVISFGAAPGFVMFALFFYRQEAVTNDFDVTAYYPAAAAFFLPIFAAIRLARFNLDTRQAEGFIGMPVPSMGYIVAGLPFIVVRLEDGAREFLLHPITLFFLIAALCFLMVSELRLISLKAKNFNLGENAPRVLLLGVCSVLLIFFQLAALPLCIAAYVLISLLFKPKAIE